MFFGKKSKDTGTNGAKPAGGVPDSKPVAASPTAPKPATAGTPVKPAITAEEAKRRAASAKQHAAAFGEIVTLLVRSQNFKNLPMSDLEWLAAPAIQNGQYAIATAQFKSNGAVTPAAGVLWACVSEEVDKRLSAAPGVPIKIAGKDWTSGDIVWVVAAVGDGRVLKDVIGRLQGREWAGKTVKTVGLDKNGKPAVGKLTSLAA